LTLVVDASVVVAALTDAGEDGSWARPLLAGDDLAAPHLLPAEVASALRRAALAGRVSTSVAASAHADLLDLGVVLVPYEPFAERIWELRQNLTPYDGWYVALAESLVASVATLDQALARAPGPRCSFTTPQR
jgi:predicted nucleic acid-binding protein